MEIAPAIGGISEYEQPKTREAQQAKSRPENAEEKALQELDVPVVKAADQQESFQKSILSAAYTGKGSFIDTVF